MALGALGARIPHTASFYTSFPHIGRPLLHSASRRECCWIPWLLFMDESYSLPFVVDCRFLQYPVAVAVSDVPRDGSHVHTHDHGRFEAPDGLPDSILLSDPKPLGKHRPPPPPSILSS
ncbi:hypothetical protein Tco_0927031 [Tanacetum coccineum]|uniref:Uncharacterized protein n=1 Tax=Tanacetum coccineum TaxID=301880 RepID=A0ABQ5DCA7_9ASTR